MSSEIAALSRSVPLLAVHGGHGGKRGDREGGGGKGLGGKVVGVASLSLRGPGLAGLVAWCSRFADDNVGGHPVIA